MAKYTGVNITNIESEQEARLNQEVFLKLAEAALELNKTIQVIAEKSKREAGIQHVSISNCHFANNDMGLKVNSKKKK